MSLNMNLNNVRVINPILTDVVQGFTDTAYVGNELFPRVPVMQRGGKIITFGKEAFKVYDTTRAPGSDTKRVGFGYEGQPFALEQKAIETVIPREWLQDAQQVPHIDLAQKAILLDMRVVMRELEVQQASVALNAANYADSHKLLASGSSKWDDAASDPIAQIEDAREVIRSSVGIYPNTLVLSARAFAALRRHPKIVDRFKYTSAQSITAAMLAEILDVEKVVVGKAVYSDDAGNFGDIWGKDAVLAYVPQTLSTMEQPSYGYTYTLDGNPLVEEAYWDNAKKSWVYGVTFERTPVIASADSAFLFKNLVA